MDESHDPKTVIHSGSLMDKIQAFYLTFLLLSIAFTILLLLFLHLNIPCLSTSTQSSKLGALDPKNPSDKKVLPRDKIFVRFWMVRRESESIVRYWETEHETNGLRQYNQKNLLLWRYWKTGGPVAECHVGKPGKYSRSFRNKQTTIQWREEIQSCFF